MYRSLGSLARVLSDRFDNPKSPKAPKRRHPAVQRAVVESMEARTLLTAYHLTFSEEFSSPLELAQSATDTRPWSALDYWNNHYVGIDKQYYSNPLTESYNPFSIANGSLSIKAQPTPAGFDADGRSWVSGEITTAKRNQYGTNPGGVGFSQKYGYFEMRAKLPLGSGFFPAFWLMPLGNNNAEYDILEGLGNNPDAAYQTQHWNNYSAKDEFVYETIIDTTTDYHTYGFEWNASTISWYVDGVKTKTGVNHSNEPMYMLVNLAIGGWNNNVVNANTNFNNTYDVDYVRVYSSDPAKPVVAPGSGYSVNPNTMPVSIHNLNDGFNQTDIGSPGAAGSGSYSSGVYTIAGSGTDIGGTSDKFRYASKILIGDGTMTARLTGLTGGDSSAKAGVMMRQSWAANAPFASLVEMPNNQVAFQYRTTAGAAVQQSTLAIPSGATYLRLTRNGNVFSGFYSTNGTTWSPVAAGQTIAMPTQIQAGLAVTSHVNTSLATATFDNVSATPAILDRTGWTATASHTAYSTTSRAIDGNFTSAWLTGQSATSAMWFNMDLGSSMAFQRAHILHDAASDKQIGGYVAYISSDGTTWTSAGSTTAISGRNVTITLNSPVNTRYLRLMPAANYSDWWSITEINLSTVPGVASAPPSTALPAGWTNASIGAVGVAGSSTYTSGTFTVNGAGADIGGGTDAFHFASTGVSGDQSIVARVTSLTNTHSSAKAGVMFRDSTHVGSANAAVVVMPGSGVRFQHRLATGQWTNGVSVAGVAAPTWVKLVRSGTTYTGYYATVSGTPTSSQWIQVGTPVNVTFTNATYRAGLAVTSRNTAALATGTFTNVSIGATSYVTSSPASPTTTLLSRTGWTATASSNASNEGAARAIDGQSTRWSTGRNPLNGWFQIDMGGAQSFRRIKLDSGSSTNDYLRGYAVYVSNNGTDWSTQTAVATGKGTGAVVDINLASNVTARYVRIVCTSSAGYWWSVSELNLYR
ncbi:MAG TPA: discoidin domain-containing protein [Tepidisphaeraceae bacterium]|jgi:beta-glucanase (GH16 family)|nr:discoidin domain-containing protein [Tepidisphaeraceae bacterium]